MPDEVQTVARPAETPRSPSRRAGLLRTLLILSALAGCFICAVLIRLAAPGDDAPSLFGATICAPTNKVDCGYVLHSQWSHFGPIPSSVLGLGYFALVGVWFAVVGMPNYAGRRWHWLPTLVVTCGAAGSLFFIYILAFTLPVICTWCIASHVANLFCVVLVWLAWPKADRSLLSEPAYPTFARVGIMVAMSVCVLAAAVLGISAYNGQVYAAGLEKRYLAVVNDPEYLHWQYTKAPQHEIAVRSDDLTLGPADAPFTLVVFSDFECAKCAQFHHYANSIVERFPGRVRCVFRHYPVSRACNPHIETAFHFFSCEAAKAAEAARMVGSPEQTHRYFSALYANMARLDQRPYEQIAVSVGLDAKRFAEAMNDPAIERRLADDIELAHTLGVEGTPSLFLNGKLLPNWQILAVPEGGASFMSGAKPDIDAAATLRLWQLLLEEGQ